MAEPGKISDGLIKSSAKTVMMLGKASMNTRNAIMIAASIGLSK